MQIRAVRGLRERTDDAFRRALVSYAEKLETSPDNLSAAICFETNGTFRADIRNPLSGAVGLIQFTEAGLRGMRARGIAVTRDGLSQMTPVEQLRYVYEYLRPFTGRLKTADDVYLAIFAPAFIGQAEGTPVYRAPSKEYEQNKALDRGNKGFVSVEDATRNVRAILAAATDSIEVSPEPPGDLAPRPVEAPELELELEPDKQLPTNWIIAAALVLWGGYRLWLVKSETAHLEAQIKKAMGEST